MPRFLTSLALTVALVTGAVGGCAAPGGTRADAPSSPTAPSGGAPAAFAVQPPPTWTVPGSRVVAWNVEFLFDGEGNEGEATFPWKGDPVAARVHRDDIAEVLRWLDADLVMMSEVENREVVEAMIAESLPGMGYQVHFVQGQDRFTGQNMALLTRLPVDEVGRLNDRAPVGVSGAPYGVSKNLWARLTLLGRPTTVIGLHFLAQPDNPERRPRREAQAEVVRRFVEAEMASGREVIVLGDFNDFDAQIPDRKASRPISDVTTIIKRADGNPAHALVNVMGDVPQAERFTSHWDRNANQRVDEGELSAIDHILLSPGLYRLARDVRYVHSHDPTRVSDHFPVVVTLAE